MASVRASLTRSMAGQRGVQVEVSRVADAVAARATARLAAHRDRGRHSVVVARRGRLDRSVELCGPAPLVLEFGRSPDAVHGATPPLAIMRGAL